MRSHLYAVQTLFVLCCAAGLAFALAACGRQSSPPTVPDGSSDEAVQETGEQLMIDAVDELESIASWATPDGGLARTAARSLSLLKTEGDSAFMYGTVTSDGLGVVVTERHTHPKGLLLITVRKSYGTPGRIVSDVSRYDSYDGFRDNHPQQTTLTEVLPASRDTIVTHVIRNGVTETYTFRLPVVTQVINQVNGTVRITNRYAAGGCVVTEVTDENQALIRRTTSSALASGALQTRTDLPGGSWKVVTTLGRGDGSIVRETVSGQ
ncbi:MAG TPA: hypothetical protein VL221_13740 [Bacteroidota bacterium]|nr:hypothetical protein [Bacteroidota bacterium]